jgi:hypothetical protein
MGTLDNRSATSRKRRQLKTDRRILREQTQADQPTQDSLKRRLLAAARCKPKMMIWRSWSCASVSGLT